MISSVTNETQNIQSVANESTWKGGVHWLLEIGLLVVLFFCFAAGIPGVNEPHYLCKAKHFWDSTFCANDIFLESADAHYLFYFTLGLLTKLMSLPAAAIAGRLICWVAIAIGWQYLSYAIVGRRFWSIPAAGVLLLFLNYCHFAGEWLIGGVEAKGLAYAFVFAGIGCVVKKNWVPVWILFGLGSAFHVLVGGWAVVAGLMVWIACRGWQSRLKTQLVSGFVGLVIAMLGLVPALVLTMGQDPTVVQTANEIYTFERIAHHLVFSHIVATAPQRLDFFLFGLLFWVGLQWVVWNDSKYRVFGLFVLATLLIASGALVIESVASRLEQPALAAKLLRYYWFRLSDVFVPAGVAFGLILVIRKCMSMRYEWGAIGLTLVSCAIAVFVASKKIDSAISKRSEADALTLPSFPGMPTEFNRKILKDWIDVCSWIRMQTPPDSRFITPRAQSTFKWYSHRSEVVAWKDVPQDAIGIVNWRNRFADVFGKATFRFGLASLDAENELLRLGNEYGAQYVVIERRHVRERKKELEFRYLYQQYLLGREAASTPFERPLCLKQVYPNSACTPEIRKDSTYLVYQLTIPDLYRPQVQALNSMLDWYRQLDELYQNQSQ